MPRRGCCTSGCQPGGPRPYTSATCNGPGEHWVITGSYPPLLCTIRALGTFARRRRSSRGGKSTGATPGCAGHWRHAWRRCPPKRILLAWGRQEILAIRRDVRVQPVKVHPRNLQGRLRRPPGPARCHRRPQGGLSVRLAGRSGSATLSSIPKGHAPSAWQNLTFSGFYSRASGSRARTAPPTPADVGTLE